jgi:CBS-domain-containing membrane protein
MSLTAKDIMSSHVITVTPATEVLELAELLAIHRISGVPVVDDHQNLVGVVSQSDLVALNKNPRIPRAITLFDWVIYLDNIGELKQELDKIAGTTVQDIMTRKVTTVGPETLLAEVATIMTDQHIHTIPVIDDDGRLAGVIGRLDIVRSLMT